MRVMGRLVFLAFATLLAGCDDGEVKDTATDGDADTDADTDTDTDADTDTDTQVVCEYAATWDGMNAFFADNCDACHADANGAGRLDLRAIVQAEVEAGGVNFVFPGDSASSQLWKVISGGVPVMPPQGILPESEICHVQEWIDAGAPI